MIIKIEGINIKDPIEGVSKAGKAWKKYGVGIKTDSVPGNETGWINSAAWDGQQLAVAKSWKEGDSVELAVKFDEKWKWQFEIPKEVETDTRLEPQGRPVSEQRPEEIAPPPEPPAQTDPGTHIEDKDELSDLPF